MKNYFPKDVQVYIKDKRIFVGDKEYPLTYYNIRILNRYKQKPTNTKVLNELSKVVLDI